MSSVQSLELFKVLDLWASCFLSKKRAVTLTPGMASLLRENLEKITHANLKPGSIKELVDELKDIESTDGQELYQNSDFNLKMYEFLCQNEHRLPKPGKEILNNVKLTYEM